MVNKTVILKTFDKIISDKCGVTVSEMHSFLDNLSSNEKRTLLKYADENLEEYDKLDSEEDLFNFERKIFDNLTKNQRNNILNYLVDFDENSYSEDHLPGYPNYDVGRIEGLMDEQQESNGYSPEIQLAIKKWTGGWFDEINHIVHNGKLPDKWDDFKGESSYKRTFKEMKKAGNDILEYIKNTDGLIESTVLYRGGHWDIGLKVGEIGESPLLMSTSYGEQTAYDIGIAERNKKNPYFIKIYAPKGSKGVNVNAPSLSPNFPEHEYLLGKGQKYIVVDVDDNNNEASILLINE